MNDTTIGRQPSTGTRLSRRGLLGGAAALLVSAGGGTAWALDRFVVEHAEVTTASDQWTPMSPGSGTVSGTSYRGTVASVDVTTHTSGTGSDTITWYAADIQLSSAESLRAAFAQDTFGQNIIENPSAIAAANDAVVAINGDYYGFRDTGIVIRNGVAFRDRGVREGLVLYRDGTLALVDETATSAAALVADGAWQAWSFGPGMVSDGQVVPGIDDVEIDTFVGNHSIQGTQPRTGLGMVGPNHLVAVVVDGRSSGYSRGVTMSEFASIFTDLGATVAYNLDGGGSSTMVFDGSVVNNPLGRGRERGTSDIILVAG